jgi:hypothetical protein
VQQATLRRAAGAPARNNASRAANAADVAQRSQQEQGQLQVVPATISFNSPSSKVNSLLSLVKLVGFTIGKPTQVILWLCLIVFMISRQ